MDGKCKNTDCGNYHEGFINNCRSRRVVEYEEHLCPDYIYHYCDDCKRPLKAPHKVHNNPRNVCFHCWEINCVYEKYAKPEPEKPKYDHTNVTIKSEGTGDTTKVMVGGVEMKGVFSVDIDEIVPDDAVIATIKAYVKLG